MRFALPSHWRQATGVDVQAAAPRGASITIGEFLRARSTPATIVGTIVGLVGTAEGSRVTVEDGTGRLVVWCAAAADPYFVVRIRNVVEIDLLSPPGSGAGASEAEIARLQAEIQGAVIRGDMAAAQAAALPFAGFVAPGSSDAVALAVRPGGSR